MQMIGVITRTIVPTESKPKRVGVRTSEGLDLIAPWDHAHDDPEVHERAAINAVRTVHPNATEITAHRTQSLAMGYSFYVYVTEASV